jgi:acetyl-CoA synthetase (ADP-forming)
MEAFALLEREGIPVLTARLARDEDEAAGVASELGFPVVLKVSSPDVIHKTETGGIRVDLRGEEEVRVAFRTVVDAFRVSNPGKRLDGAIVQRQGRGVELIVGVLKDGQFGPVLMCGLGGIFVEAMGDVAFRTIPISARDAREMLQDLRGYGVLTSSRRENVDLGAVENLLLTVSRLVERRPEIEEMDINPLFVSAAGVQVCDARVKTWSDR